ncbi:universal stress protein [Sphingomonas sp. Leaf38]|uniref:universal stress protein n=1 Tax=Sphingomonas sp. Leaf38 TaxID=1736217 RepID=UPI0006FE7891|nr:universal stress protein [Sphingomonas sp. Leaf38]KQN32968.1 hypothetical protein ASE88_03190 [Sphingomonas sp. Leaf38]
MKTILLLIHDDEGQEARYQAALDVARAVGGHLACLDLTIVPEYVGDYSVPMTAGGLLLAEETAVEAAHASRMRSRIEREDVPFDWTSTTGFLSQTLEARAGLIDLIVVSTDHTGAFFAHMTHVIGDLLVHTGKPVLAVPPASCGFTAQSRAVVAWDGSQDAEAALCSALPLLRIAKSVTLFHADTGAMTTDVDEAARYLSRHGIKSTVKNEPIGLERVSEALVREVASEGYDSVVMGGFGHTRTIEAIFGGATRTMLLKCDVPMLLVHRR